MFEYIIAGVGLAIVSRYITKHLPQIKGTHGEAKLARAIKHLRLPGKVKVMRDSLFRAEWGGTSQVDVLAVTRYGILVLENKNYNCDVYGTTGEQNWLCKYPRGGVSKDPFDYSPAKKQYTQVEPLYNPIKQNSTHVSAVSAILREQFPQVPFYPLVVFSNDTDLHVQNSRNRVCNLSQLANVVPRLLGKEVLTDKQVEEISNILEQAQIKGRQARKNHVTEVELGREVRETYSKEDLTQIRDEFFRMAEDKPILTAEGEISDPAKPIPTTAAQNRPLNQILQTANNVRGGNDTAPAQNDQSGRQHAR